MAALLLIAVCVGVDLYQVSVRCLKSGFSITNIIQALREFHDEVQTSKYLECIDEIYENSLNSKLHLIGIDCVNCRRKIHSSEMICNKIENAIQVDGCDEAFEILSDNVSKI